AKPSVSGQSVTLNATVSVTPPGSTAVAYPSGTVSFKEGATTLGPGTLSTTGGVTTATFSTSTLSTATHNLTAIYGGDSNFITSSGSLTQIVQPAHTTTTLSSSVNPSVSGQSVTLTATVSVNSPGSTAVANPTGTVNFYDGSTWIRSGSLRTTAGVTTASFSTYSLAVGSSHSITATYADDSNFNPSTSAAVTQVIS